MTTPAIDIHGLRKSFGDKVVLDDISFQVPAGTVFALLGPNGAGKTTVVHICSTLLAPDEGSVAVGGFDVVADADGVRSQIGLTGQFAAVDGLLTGRENLQLMADLRRLPRKTGRDLVGSLLEKFDLVDAAAKPVSSYSGGMRRRLDLAMTLIGGATANAEHSSPAIIFLDEPTTGLDPRSRATMWDIVRGLVAEGITIFLTTQYLEEADQLADQIALLDGGRIVAQGTPTDLKRRVPGGHVRLSFSDVDARDVARHILSDHVLRDGDKGDDKTDGETGGEALTLTVASDGSFSSVKSIVDKLDADVQVEGLSIETPNLDDVFFALTGANSTTTQEVSK